MFIKAALKAVDNPRTSLTPITNYLSRKSTVSSDNSPSISTLSIHAASLNANFPVANFYLLTSRFFASDPCYPYFSCIISYANSSGRFTMVYANAKSSFVYSIREGWFTLRTL